MNHIKEEEQPDTLVFDLYFERTRQRRRSVKELTEKEKDDLISHLIDSYGKARVVLDRFNDAFDIIGCEQM